MYFSTVEGEFKHCAARFTPKARGHLTHLKDRFTGFQIHLNTTVRLLCVHASYWQIKSTVQVQVLHLCKNWRLPLDKKLKFSSLGTSRWPKYRMPPGTHNTLERFYISPHVAWEHIRVPQAGDENIWVPHFQSCSIFSTNSHFLLFTSKCNWKKQRGNNSKNLSAFCSQTRICFKYILKMFLHRTRTEVLLSGYKNLTDV